MVNQPLINVSGALLSIALLVPLNACGAVKGNVIDNAETADVGRRFLPHVEECAPINGYALNGKVSPESYSHWHVRLNRGGTLFWNGVAVDIATLGDYLSKIKGMKANSEFVSAEIEPGASCSAVDGLRKVLVESGLCAEGKCTENVWNIQTPMVN